jgi:hypothetical protein
MVVDGIMAGLIAGIMHVCMCILTFVIGDSCRDAATLRCLINMIGCRTLANSNLFRCTTFQAIAACLLEHLC